MAQATIAPEIDPAVEMAFDQLWLRVQRQFSKPDQSIHDAVESFADSGLEIRHSSIQSLVVTSWSAGEGATTVAAGMAACAAARVLGDVCLVDADFQAGPEGYSQTAGLDDRQGLSNLLHGECSLDNAIVPPKAKGFWRLPRGNASPDAVVTDAKIQRVIPMLEERFRYVLYDTCCLKSGVEAYRWGRYVRNSILVVAAGSARRQTVAHAVASMRSQGLEILGAILNKRVDAIPGWLYPYM